MKPVKLRPGLEYVTISHVWANGLGNPKENSLPRCQLARLGESARLMRSTCPESISETELGFLCLWIDPLCCPVDPLKWKAHAVSLLSETYPNAFHVLVLDYGIQSIRHDEIDPYEALLRVDMSAWTQRLWNLQEGVLAKRLWFQFKDIPVEVEMFYERLKSNALSDIRQLCFQADIVDQIFWSRKYQDFSGDTSQMVRGLGNSLWGLDHALQHRSVSVPSDKPLCICITLNLPIKKSHGSTEQRAQSNGQGMRS